MDYIDEAKLAEEQIIEEVEVAEDITPLEEPIDEDTFISIEEDCEGFDIEEE